MSYQLSNDKHLIGPWVCEKVGLTWGPEGRETIGVVEDNSTVISGVIYENLTGKSVQCHIAVEGGLRKLLPAIFIYAFIQLKVEKMIAMVNTANPKSITFCCKLGFEPEALIKDVYPDGDMVVLVLNKKDCMFLPQEVRQAA